MKHFEINGGWFDSESCYNRTLTMTRLSRCAWFQRIDRYRKGQSSRNVRLSVRLDQILMEVEKRAVAWFTD